jgi:YegS/Rv2252/BmrU family lipid kinase
VKHVFIVNPRAGKNDQRARIYEMADALRDRHGLNCTVMLTDRPGGATDMARKVAESGEEVRLYACGGDGTIHEVANGIAGFDNAAMTAVPIGTGNDFLKNFGPDAEKFRNAENLWNGDIFPLDLIDCNGRYALTIACNGIDARVAESVHQYKRSPMLNGRGSYLASVAVNFLLKGIGHHWTVWLDDKKIEDDFSLVSMCNGRYYGGGSTPVPEARMDDDILHTVVIKKLNKATFARLFSPYSAGEYRKLPPELIQVYDAKVVRIQSDSDIVTCLDGECSRSREVVMKLADKRVNFFGPKGCNPNATSRIIE